MITFAGVVDLLEPRARRHDPAARLLINLCLAATAAGLLAAALTLSYGYPTQAGLILLGALTLPATLWILRYGKTSLMAGHFLAANLLIQIIAFAPDPALGCVVLIGLSAGVALLGRQNGLVWLAAIVVRCLYVVSTTEATSATTAAIAAMMSVLVYLAVQMSEHSRTRAALREQVAARQSSNQTAMLMQLVEETFDAFVVTSRDHVYSASASIERFLGYTPAEFSARPLDFFLHPEESEIQARLEPGQPPTRLELRLRHADGHWVWVEVYVAPDIRQATRTRFFLALRNYDQQRKVEDQLTQAQRLESMGALAAAVAHDFNNMLTAILGLAEDLPESHARTEITRAANRAAGLTNTLLTFGRRQAPSSSIHDLSYLLHEWSHFVQHSLDSRYILIESYVDEPTLVRIEEPQFEQVLMNLLNNAREAMPVGGEVEISLQSVELDDDHGQGQAGHYALLEVRDSGAGISAEVQTKMFDPFFSTKRNAKNHNKENSGLGLSSCYGIVSRAGGFIEVDSHPGNGTVMKVYLPIAETRDYQPVLEVLDNEISVLVVDDDPGVLNVVKASLVRNGYHVRAFTEPAAAIDFCTPGKVSMVVTDVVMKGMTGGELVRELRKQIPDLPALFISGYARDEIDNWQADARTAYLAKPFRRDEIVARVESLLRVRH